MLAVGCWLSAVNLDILDGMFGYIQLPGLTHNIVIEEEIT